MVTESETVKQDFDSIFLLRQSVVDIIQGAADITEVTGDGPDAADRKELQEEVHHSIPIADM